MAILDHPPRRPQLGTVARAVLGKSEQPPRRSGAVESRRGACYFIEKSAMSGEMLHL